MLTDEQILAELARLGVDRHSYRVVSLMPLVMVAWADREVQPEEREMILEVAAGHGIVGGMGGAVLEGWLRRRPTNDMFRRGILLFVHLAHREEGVGADLPRSSVEYAVDLCEMVAEAAGGVFGFGPKTSAVEARAIRAVATAMAEESARLDPMGASHIKGRTLTDSWMAMVDALDEELPC